MEGSLSKLEMACLASMVRQGHNVTLHTYDDQLQVPEGVTIADANLVTPYSADYRREATAKRPGNTNDIMLSDYFRFVLLEKEMGVWCDADVFFLRPLEMPSHGYVMAYEKNHKINSAVLCLHKDSQIFKDIWHALLHPNKTPYWEDFTHRYLKRAKYFLTGKKWHLGCMSWSIVGAKALTALVPKYHLESKVMSKKAFYFLDRKDTAYLYESVDFQYLLDDEEIIGIHIYDKSRKHEEPVKGSFFEYAVDLASL